VLRQGAARKRGPGSCYALGARGRVLETSGVEFTNGEAPGVRLKT
jgi:hypothetical protein